MARQSTKTATKTTTTNTEKRDIYQEITDNIITTIEKGVIPWQSGYSLDSKLNFGILPTRSNGEFYRGINLLYLWGESLLKGYTSTYWFTFIQA
jgi:antirestriction protein ArdC